MMSVEVSSPQWEVTPGPVPFGMNSETALALLGEPTVNMADSGGRAFMYLTKGERRGGVFLTFRGEKLKAILWAVRCAEQGPDN